MATEKKAAAKKTGAKKSVVKTAVAPAKKAVAKSPAAPAAVKKNEPTQREIAELAVRFWGERGHQHGHHEQDWLRAERQLKGK